MNSPFSLLFLALQARIAAITTGDPATPAFKFIDQDLGQLEMHNGDNRPPVLWPCALIDIDEATFENLSDNSQAGVIKVCIRIGFPPYSATSAATPATYRNKALAYYELEQALHTMLHGWYPSIVQVTETEQADLSDTIGHLIRTTAVTERRSDIIRVRALTYTISMDDYSTQQLPTPTPFTPSPATIHLTTTIE